MKRIFAWLFLISICNHICAQKAMFVRIYNLNGNKINKGYILATTDTSLLIKTKGKDTVNLAVNSIGKIKTKRSPGQNLLIGSLTGAAVGAIWGAATADPDAMFLGYTTGEGAVLGALAGLHIGAAIGGITVLFKNSKTFLINGNIENWKTFQSSV